MKSHVTRYFLAEGIRGVFLHGFMSFAAIGVILACLIIMGSFGLLIANIDKAVKDLESTNEITAYIDTNLSPSAARSVGSRINLLDNVSLAEYESKEEALSNFSERTSENHRALLEGLEEDSKLRDRYRIFLVDLSLADETIKAIENIEGVAEVKALLDVIDGLTSGRRVIETVSLFLIVILLAISLFIISNTIKLATFDRRDEIGIMRIVGATKGFIRWPFVVEGFLLGITAAIAAFFIEMFIYTWFRERLISRIMNIDIIPFSDVFLPMLLIYLGIGFVVGVAGSLLTIRKFLRV